VKRLIISADDFGLTHSINEGVLRAAREGVVTNINLIPTGLAADDAIATLKYDKIPEIGVHLALTETRPTANPRLISSLVDSDGLLPASRTAFLKRFLSGRIDTSHIRTELNSQMDKAAHSGARITNLSTHEHLHMIPVLFRMVADIARERGVRFVRVLRKESLIPPLTLKKMVRSVVVAYFSPGMERMLKKSGLSSADNFMGLLNSGQVSERVLLRMVGNVGDGVTELVTHPGFLDPEVLDRYRFHINCEEELYALTGPKVKKAIADNGITLCGYGSLEAE
jgi:predicted glycoside hydrolase/deacetylase ChbG (UPF0249 family)